MKKETRYPIIFVHGMFGWGYKEGINDIIPYWGATTGDLATYLNGIGYESYCASVGPLSSAWDQACELYAQLTGTRVDYGKAHSKREHHGRYGRKWYKPIITDWSEEKKVHLIGHSFGGNCIRMLAHLLTYGDEQERMEGTDDISPLFMGGKSNLVCSVTTICSPMNGTNAHEAAQRIKLIKPMIWGACTYAGVFGRSALNGKLVDFHLEQFGLTAIPHIKRRNSLIKALIDICKTKDSVEYDMSPIGSQLMNDRVDISPDIYYTSYMFNVVEKSKRFDFLVPKHIDFPFLGMTSAMLIVNAEYNLRKTETEQDFGNDGLVNVTSGTHPLDEPFKSYDGSWEPGIWNVMPLRQGDHGTPIGLFANTTDTRRFYLDMLTEIKAIEKAQQKRAKEEKAKAEEAKENIEPAEKEKVKKPKTKTKPKAQKAKV